jgi:hypothetical protein
MQPRQHIVTIDLERYDLLNHQRSGSMNAFINERLMEVAKSELPRPAFRKKWDVLGDGEITQHNYHRGCDPRTVDCVGFSITFTEVEDLKFHKKFVKASRRRWHSYTGRKR